MYKKIILFIAAFTFVIGAMAQDTSLQVIKQLRQALGRPVTGTDRIKLLLDLALAYVHLPGETTHDLDTAQLLVRQAQALNTAQLHDKALAARALYVSANAFRERGDTAAGHQCINQAIAIYKTVNQPDEAALAYVEAINYVAFETEEDVAVRIALVQQALALFRQSGNREKQAATLKDLADYNQLLHHYGEAKTQLTESLTIYDSLGRKDVQGLYDLLGSISLILGDYTNAINYGLMALQTAEAQQDTTMQLCTICNRLALSYGNLKKYKEEGMYLEKGLSIALKYKEKEAAEMLMLNLVYNFIHLSKPQAALDLLHKMQQTLQLKSTNTDFFFSVGYYGTYKHLNDSVAAAKYGHALMQLEQNLHQLGMFCILYEAITDYLIAAHRFPEARRYLTKFKQYAVKVNSIKWISKAYLQQALLDSAAGNIKAALSSFMLYKRVDDSLRDEAKSFQYVQMQVAYETDKKNDSLKINQQKILNLTTNNRLKEADLKQAGFVRNAIILAALALLSVLYIGYRFKQLSNAKLQAQQQAISQQNQLLQRTLDEKNNLLIEKEWLVKEIHHRVKNNLQIMTSLLNTQSKYLDSKEAIEAIAESRHRMQAMSLIHQKLYQSDDIAFVNMQQYIAELTDYLKTSLADTKQINFDIAVEALELDVAQAIPIGLILNEAITNTIKYAFTGRAAGTIRIVLHKQNGLSVLLQISDNGLGLPQHSNSANADTMGMRLIKGLVKQIGGNLVIESKEGLTMSVTFNTDSVLKKISTTSTTGHQETRMYG